MEAARIDGASEWGCSSRSCSRSGSRRSPRSRSSRCCSSGTTSSSGSSSPSEPADRARDRVAAAPVRLQPRRARAGVVLLGDHPADSLRALPALLRPGPARRLRQVGRDGGAGRDRRLRARRLRRLRDPAARGPSARTRSPSSAATPTRPARGGRGRRRSGSGWMRSESDGHCAPTSFPGLAVREAARRRDPAPLVLSVFDRYRPTVEEFLRHVAELRERSRWDESVVLARIDRIAAVDGGFEVGGHGVFRHVLVATGHPGLAVPDELAGDPRVVHAYEPHEYASRVAVVGAGMAAATEWLNALAAGSEVVSVRRREPAQAAAQRRPAVLHASAASPASTPRRGPPRRAPARLRRAVVSARPRLGRADRGGRARGPLPRRAGGRRRRAGDLRHGLPGRLPRTTRCWRGSSRSTGSRARTAGSCSPTTRPCRA